MLYHKVFVLPQVNNEVPHRTEAVKSQSERDLRGRKKITNYSGSRRIALLRCRDQHLHIEID